jgi:hypothetical protein
VGPGRLAGGYTHQVPESLASRIEDSFVQRLRTLPGPTQRLLLTAAAEPLGDVALLQDAAGRLGIGLAAARPAEAAGFIEIGAQVHFHHPLVRAAAYHAGTIPDRRDVHRALAEATDPDLDPDRRAWHRAQATTGPDEEVAAELERSADRAAGRGGVAAEAAFLQRASELTPTPGSGERGRWPPPGPSWTRRPRTGHRTCSRRPRRARSTSSSRRSWSGCAP